MDYIITPALLVPEKSEKVAWTPQYDHLFSPSFLATGPTYQNRLRITRLVMYTDE